MPKKINLTRDGVYKIFDKETIATDQLQKISAVLNHDFFSYYQLSQLNDKNSGYGFAAKEDVENLKKVVNVLAEKIDRLMEELPSIKQRPARRNKRS